MSIRIKLAITLVTFLAAMAFTTTASAQAGLACSGTTCGLGGQIRGQIGDGLPLPISIAPGYTGPFKGGTSAGGYNNAVIHTAPATPSGAPLVGQGLGQPGQIKPTTMATVMQTTTGAHPHAITLPAEQFGFGPAPQGSIGVVNFNKAVFAVQTNLIFDAPHPGTNGTGMAVSVPGGGGSRMLSAGGRPGLPTVSYYAGAVGSPSNNYGNTAMATITPMAGDVAGNLNGVARFTSTGNQFGGISTGRTLGTAKVFFNGVGSTVDPGDLPCTGTTACRWQLSTVIPGTTGVAGGPFGGSVNNAAFTTPTGVYQGTIGFNGTIVNTLGAVTTGGGITPTATGPGIFFKGQAATSVGFPVTTGMLTIQVTSMIVDDPPETWIRTGTDARDANGNGVIATVTGSMSKRNISLGNANRTWTTLEIPEPSAIMAASAGLFALFGCHQLVRRRNR
jgi:hypothetical protein